VRRGISAKRGRSDRIYPSHVATVGGGGAAAALRGVVDDDAVGEGAELDSQL
jgi:hypothetical protein